MRWIQRILVVVLLLLVLIFGLLFSLQNSQSVPLDLLVLQLQARPIAVWLLATFAFGGVVGLLVGTTALLRVQASRYRLRRRLENCEKELSELKSTPIAVQTPN
jgi:putative membrane protein